MASIFEIQDGGGRHLGFCSYIIWDVRNVFCIDVITCPPILVKIGHLVKKLHQFVEIQDGGGCPFRKYTSG
jgi:hypothetical protein